MEKRKLDTKKLTVLAMLAALSFIVMVVGRIPVVLFLKYDPKDVVITIAGFILSLIHILFPAECAVGLNASALTGRGWMQSRQSAEKSRPKRTAFLLGLCFAVGCEAPTCPSRHWACPATRPAA